MTVKLPPKSCILSTKRGRTNKGVMQAGFFVACVAHNYKQEKGYYISLSFRNKALILALATREEWKSVSGVCMQSNKGSTNLSRSIEGTNNASEELFFLIDD